MPTDSEEDEGEDNEAGLGGDADTLESISLIEESLEELAQARSLLKAADNKVRGQVICDMELPWLLPLPPPFTPSTHGQIARCAPSFPSHTGLNFLFLHKSTAGLKRPPSPTPHPCLCRSHPQGSSDWVLSLLSLCWSRLLLLVVGSGLQTEGSLSKPELE